MHFNTYCFILLFLPVFLGVYYITSRYKKILCKAVIILFGFIFYAYAGVPSVLMLIGSMIINYLSINIIIKQKSHKKIVLLLCVVLNITFLLYIKYADFAIDIINNTFDWSLLHFYPIIPLGISFLTFQQIMFVIDYAMEEKVPNLSDYMAYILFFPKIVMGPIVKPKELISMLNNDSLKKPNANNIAIGLKMFSFGLFKKMMLADTFSKGVSWGFDNWQIASSMEIILTMIFFSFEIYFDFSGYSDMAVGIAKMINIDLPMNFDSPYKAFSIRDFWKKWHISLTKFFTYYVYYPLGGNRKGKLRTYFNIFIVFILSGIWHGANYTFILWGVCYAILQIIERLLGKIIDRIPKLLRWLYTFGIVNVLWLLFRADTITQCWMMLRRMFSLKSLTISAEFLSSILIPELEALSKAPVLNYLSSRVRCCNVLFLLAFGFGICLIPKNNYRTQDDRKWFGMIAAAIAFVLSFLCLSSESVFVYNNF